ncbi:tetratricopeptide repeat protein [Chloroflexota bacterium]
MKDISLRVYHQEIEKLIGEGLLNQAVSHCQHILKSLPMNLDTYRLLGKSYLEAKKYTEAADIFKRLLMSLPDDFVSHVGMSIIRDDENNLEDSIWHMERAFEVQPSNPAIQEELKKLYGRRDGKVPSKIRLTRDALANMYTQGALYSQAIAEISSVLAEDSDRPDLKVMLARAYSRDGRKKQAIDICTGLLKKYPYCFEALKILIELLSSPENHQTVAGFKSKLFAMDPYAEHSMKKDLDSQDVPDNAVMIKRLDGSLESSDDFIPTIEKADESRIVKPDEEQIRIDVEDEGKSIILDDLDLEQIKPNSITDIPDWIKELAPENIVVGESIKDVEVTQEDSRESENKVSKTDQILGDQAREKLMEGSLEDIPKWLQEMGTDELFKSDEETEIPVQEGLDKNGDSYSNDSEIPEWLKEEKDGLIPGDYQFIEGEDSELPEWLRGIESEKDRDDLKSMDGFDPTLRDGISEKDAIDRIPDPSNDQTTDDEAFSTTDTAQVISGSDFKPGLDSDDVDDSILEPVVPVIEPDDLDSVSEMDQELDSTGESVDHIDDDAAFAWLESLAAKQGVNPDELTSDPKGKDVEPPDWIKNAIKEESLDESLAGERFEKKPYTPGSADQVEDGQEISEETQTREISQPLEPIEEGFPSELDSLLEEGLLKSENQDDFEGIFDLNEDIETESDSMTEKSNLERTRETLLQSGEIDDSKAIDQNIPPESIPDEAQSKEEEYIESVENARPGRTRMSGDWKPLDEVAPEKESDDSDVSEPDMVTSDEELSQLGRVSAGGVLTKIPGKDVEKEADILEQAQLFLSRRDLKNALEEYQKLIKKGKLLEGVIHDLKEISYQYPIDVSVWQLLGDAYMRANQLKEALESYTKAEEFLR